MNKINCNKIPPFKGWVLENFPFIEADFDAITNYQLICKVIEYLNQVIASENAQNEAIEDLYNKLNALQNYIDNLDLQDEVNNKLDEMAESGELDQIIEQYLNSSTVWGFDTVAEMKEATNLINGSYTRTLGYYEKNDGGSALYKIRNITNDDVVDEMFIIGMSNNNLIAELIIINELNVLSIGGKGDNEFDNNEILQASFNSIYDVFIPKGKYISNGSLTCVNEKSIKGNGTIIFINSTNDGLLIGDSIELEGIELNTGTDFTGTVLTYDGSLGIRSYPSTSKINNIVISTNASNNIECLFDYKPDRNYGMSLNNIKLGKISDTRKSNYGFKALMTKWANSITINNMNIDIYGINPFYVDNESGVSGSGKNWTFNNITVQARNVTYNEGFLFKKMLNFVLNSCYMWDTSDGNYSNGIVVLDGCRYIMTNGCSEEFYSPTILNTVSFIEAFSGYTTETDNYHRTPLLRGYTSHGDSDKLYPLLFPSINQLQAVNDIEIFSRYASGKQDGIYSNIITRGMTNYNNFYARDIIIKANFFANNKPIIYKIALFEEGTVLWVKGNTDVYLRCSCGEKPRYCDNETLTEIATGNSITMTPISIGTNEPLAQTGTVKYFYNQKVIDSTSYSE